MSESVAPPLSVIDLNEVFTLENLESRILPCNRLLTNICLLRIFINLRSVPDCIRFQRSLSNIDSSTLSSLDMSGFITAGGEILLLLDRIALASRALRNLSMTRIGLGRSCFSLYRPRRWKSLTDLAVIVDYASEMTGKNLSKSALTLYDLDVPGGLSLIP